jgi:hypothetical protein
MDNAGQSVVVVLIAMLFAMVMLSECALEYQCYQGNAGACALVIAHSNHSSSSHHDNHHH